MIVGSTTEVVSIEQRDKAFQIVAGSASLSVTNPDGTPYGTSPPVWTGAVEDDYATQALHAKITPTQAGRYRLAWTFQDDAGETVKRIGVAFATWTDASGFVRRRLQETPITLPDNELDPELWSAARFVLGRWVAIGTNDPGAPIGSYNGLAGMDQEWFDEAIGLMTAARLVGPRTSGGAPTDTVIRHEGDTQYRYAETARDRSDLDASPGDSGAGPGGYAGQSERKRWYREAAECIGKISVVRASLTSSATSFRPFRVSGPTRTATANGVVPTLMSNIVRLLSDDYDAYLADAADSWD